MTLRRISPIVEFCCQVYSPARNQFDPRVESSLASSHVCQVCSRATLWLTAFIRCGLGNLVARAARPTVTTPHSALHSISPLLLLGHPTATWVRWTATLLHLRKRIWPAATLPMLRLRSEYSLLWCQTLPYIPTPQLSLPLPQLPAAACFPIRTCALSLGA